MDTGLIEQAEAALTEQDPLLGKLIASQQLKPRIRRTDYFEALSRSIIGQQVSVAAAHAIFGRFQETTGLKPLQVTLLDEAAIKQIGLSRQKAGYLRDL